MPEVGIVSRLSTFGGITVTVNTAANEVAVILVGTPDLSVNGAIMNFLQGDNFTVEGFSLSLPYQFGQGTISPGFFQLGWRDNAANNGSVDEVGDGGRINIPDPNQWYDTFAFIPQPATVADKYHLEVVGLGFNVSMFNAPAVLNTAVLACAIHLKVRHTLALIG